MPALTLALYRGLTGLAAPALPLILGRRVRRAKEDPARLGERFGRAGLPRPPGPLVWIHAASVGESLSVLPLIDRLIAADPGRSILVTSGTVTSAALLRERLPAGAMHQFVPVDQPAAVARFLDHWRPDAGLWVESELWPNLIGSTQRRGIPTLLIQGRMSARSHRSWRWLPGLIRPVLSGFALVLAQTEADAARFRDLGAGRVIVTGSLKFAAPSLPHDPAGLDALRHAIGDRPVFLAASIHPGEDKPVIRAQAALRRKHHRLLTIIVPRHPDRGAELAELAGYDGPGVARRSLGQPITGETRIYIADTIGELGLFYRLAPVVFIGGSLIPHGGQNPVEPVQLGAVVISGPDMTNFAEVTDGFAEADAHLVARDGAELARLATDLLRDPARCRALASRQQAVIAAKAGVLECVTGLIAPYLPADSRADAGA